MINNRLAAFRAIHELSRQDLAYKLEVNYQTIGYIERGDYSPSLELAFKIAKIFNVPITDIFSDEPFKPLLGRVENNDKKQ